MEQLKPCPFCGAIPTIKWESWSEISDDSGCYRLDATHDKECFLRKMDGLNLRGTMSAFNKQSLIIAWNRRVTDVDNH